MGFCQDTGRFSGEEGGGVKHSTEPAEAGEAAPSTQHPRYLQSTSTASFEAQSHFPFLFVKVSGFFLVWL